MVGMMRFELTTFWPAVKRAKPSCATFRLNRSKYTSPFEKCKCFLKFFSHDYSKGWYSRGKNNSRWRITKQVYEISIRSKNTTSNQSQDKSTTLLLNLYFPCSTSSFHLRRSIFRHNTNTKPMLQFHFRCFCRKLKKIMKKNERRLLFIKWRIWLLVKVQIITMIIQIWIICEFLFQFNHLFSIYNYNI